MFSDQARRRKTSRDASSIGGIKDKYEVAEAKKVCRREHAPSVRPGGLTTRWLVMWAHGLENAQIRKGQISSFNFLGWVVGELLFYHRVLCYI